ncbi:MAG: cyclophilin-like fold protein [Atopobiaceae bacterium]|jgi:hypothetical protein|nr:cyclophilin-like fold protein [Atopobiaceae bacterium]
MPQNITMRFGSTEVGATLDDSETARAFAEKLPTTIHVSGTGVDFCGRMPFELPYEQRQVHRGWKDGDVNYNPGGGWFAVLFADEENSMRYGDQVSMGRVDGDLSVLRGLSGTYDLTIERR